VYIITIEEMFNDFFCFEEKEMLKGTLINPNNERAEGTAGTYWV